jgi:hypothetical protein
MSSKIERVNLFTLDAFTVDIEDVDLDQINKDIDAMEEFKVSFDPKDTHFEDRKFPDTPECDKLKERMLEEVCKVTGKEMACETIWTITLYEGQSVNYHTHKSNLHLYPDEYFSVAFYTKVPEGSADFLFYLPICNAIEQILPLTPKAGRMTIFNSYVPHMTGRHHAKESRIVVSANYVPVHPKTKPNPDWSDYYAD